MRRRVYHVQLQNHHNPKERMAVCGRLPSVPIYAAQSSPYFKQRTAAAEGRPRCKSLRRGSHCSCSLHGSNVPDLQHHTPPIFRERGRNLLRRRQHAFHHHFRPGFSCAKAVPIHTHSSWHLAVPGPGRENGLARFFLSN